MAIQLSDRVQRVKPSPTLAISALAQKLAAEGRDIINLGVGQPDFPTPEHIKDEGHRAITENDTGYTAVDGIPELKDAIISKFKRDNQLDYEADQILVSCGGKQSFSNLCQALLNDGDEVIVPAPYWVSYPDMVLLAGAKPVIVEAGQESNFKLTADMLENAITDKTRLFVINSPSNPTGVSYSKEELSALGKVLLKYPDIIVATDDMYELILFGNLDVAQGEQKVFTNILNETPELYDRCVVLNGVSKAYAMTGWRIGYLGAPEWIAKACNKMQGQITSGANCIAQMATIAALEAPVSKIKFMVDEFKVRRDLVLDLLSKVKGFNLNVPEGAFYVFPNISYYFGKTIAGIKINNANDFSLLLLEKANVATVTGEAFGQPNCIRLSYATSQKILIEAIRRIGELLKH